MAVGKTLSKGDVDNALVGYSRDFTQVLDSVAFQEFRTSILTLDTAGLEALGYTTQEAGTIRAFVDTMQGHIDAYDRDDATKGGRFYARQFYKTYNG